MNYFKDVCPQLLPRKLRGRDTKIEDEMDRKENIVFGAQKVFTDIDGLDLYRETEGRDFNPAEELLDNKDLKKIRFLQLRKAALKVDKKGFALDKPEEETKIEGSKPSKRQKISKKEFIEQESYEGDESGEDEFDGEEGEEESMDSEMAREMMEMQEEGEDEMEEESEEEEDEESVDSDMSENEILMSLLKKKPAPKVVQKPVVVKQKKEEPV
jgi:hypothetical protein